MNQSPIHSLFEALRGDFARDVQGPNAKQMIADYVSRHDDWHRYLNFRPTKYTRNLVGLDDRFELLVLCWNPGQETPIHNHEGQNCWMAVLQGELEEVHFAFPGEAAGSLRRLGSFDYRPGDVGYIHDDIALHVIRPLGERPCVSLHLYSLPFRECNIYCPETGRISRKTLSYDTVNGSIGRV
jgi:cysteine dioxygenase